MFLSFYHFLWAFVAAIFYGFPSKRIFVFGVTGTKGKSTVLELVNAILESGGKKTALLSSVRIKIDKESKENSLGNSMPGRGYIQKFLRQAVNAGCDYALIEVTSQGILQHRHKFIEWGAALFTNLAPEHIEAHGGFENYREAKLKFFRYISRLKDERIFFINQDDANAKYFAEAAGDGQIVSYSKNNPQITTYNLQSSLKTDFNRENIAAALAFAKSQGISDEVIKKAVENFAGVPGRMEIVVSEPFEVIVDYAHTPDSLEKVYQALKPKTPDSKLIGVLGSAGGGRDKWKRPKMGEIAAKYCDVIILANEDPYDENPGQIFLDIKSGIPKDFPVCNLYEYLDRREAIKKALSLAKGGDVVIMTGKGSEQWIHIEKGKKIPWNERKTAEELLKESKN